MNKNKKYYSMAVEDSQANIYIYGDIVSWEWFESDVSSYTLAKEIEGLDVDTINIYINSYGGETAEGLAIYNALRRHKATVKTYNDGFACSAASMVFMAGDERIMSNTSLVWVHNAQWVSAGDYNDLRKDADDLEKINEAAVQVYMNHISITEDELRAMMDVETWISPEEALEMGFATSITNGGANKKPTQSLRKGLIEMILTWQNQRQELDPEPEPTEPVEPEQDPGPEPDEPEQNRPKNLMAALFR